MSQEKIEKVKKAITSHEGFPKPGIVFRNIFPVLRDPLLFKTLMDVMVESVRTNAKDVELIIGLDARGFLFGPMLAQALNIGFAPIRKSGKLPGETHRISYKLEYGEDSFDVEKEAIKEGTKVVIVDDLLATGGTMKAACDLVKKAGGMILNCLVVIELLDLKGREKISQPLTALIQY